MNNNKNGGPVSGPPQTISEEKIMSHRLDETASGVYVIAVTPFTDAGLIDEASIDSLVEDYLGAGAHGLTILGIMGEAAKLLDDERERVLGRYVQATAGRVPVVAGVSARATHMALDYARRAEDAGADQFCDVVGEFFVAFHGGLISFLNVYAGRTVGASLLAPTVD